MKYMRVVNSTRDKVICDNCGRADGFWARARGLMGRPSLEAGHGLWLAPCPSIHMFHMKFALDVIFLTKENTVTDIVENIAPGKTYVAKGQQGKAHSAIEVPVGTIGSSGTQIGDTIVFEEIAAS